jgi:hypothetical protein
MSDDRLDHDLIRALQAGDLVGVARTYADAADMMETGGDVDRACFFYTQAWVFAMEAGHPLAEQLRARLVAHGRETEE